MNREIAEDIAYISRRCSMPNLAAEILVRGDGGLERFARCGGMTKDVLIAFLCGKGEITVGEFKEISLLCECSVGYLWSKRLDTYDLSSRKQKNRVQRLLRECECRISACDPEGQYAKNIVAHIEAVKARQGILIRAELNWILRMVKLIEIKMELKQRKQREGGSRHDKSESIL